MNVPSPAWRELSDTRGMRLLALERKPDSACSNSFLLLTDDFLVLVDPGADPIQRDLFQREAAYWNRPVLVALTHCHRDHCRETGSLLARLRPNARVLAHTLAADAFARGDRQLTLSFLYGEPPPAPPVHIRLDFPGVSGEGMDRFTTTEIGPAAAETLRCGNRQFIHFLSTPGHSPDSLCLVAGHHLITGDLLFASRPGVAGIPGWNRQEAIRSMILIRDLLRRPGMETCHTGHRSSLPADQAADELERAICETERLPDLLTLDADRAAFLKTYGDALLREITIVLTACAGHLHLAASVLEQLEEKQLADEMIDALDLDGMDGLLSAFEAFAAQFDPASGPLMAVPLKGVQTLDRLERTLGAAGSADLLPHGPLNRARGLMRHFMNTVRGFRPRDSLAPVRLAPWLQTAIHDFLPSENETRDWLALADSPAAFSRKLAARLAERIRRPHSPIELIAPDDAPTVWMEPELMAGLLRGTLERLEMAGASSLRIALQSGGNHPQLVLTGAGPGVGSAIGRRSIELWTTLCSQFDAAFSCAADRNALRLSWRFPESPATGS